HALRFRTPLEGETVIDDQVKDRVVFQNAELDDFIIVRSDGMPVYNFCVVVDDHDMRITHVIRGDDLLASTPRQVLLYRAFGATPPAFAHVPQILGSIRLGSRSDMARPRCSPTGRWATCLTRWSTIWSAWGGRTATRSCSAARSSSPTSPWRTSASRRKSLTPRSSSG